MQTLFESDADPADGPTYTRREVIYGRTFGTSLTMDVFSPKQAANGAAIIFVVSEGWYSEHAKITPNIPVYVEPFVARGYTVFAVLHGSNPKFSLPEYIEDLHRAVRFIRHGARKFGIDPDRIGSTGDSAGAHLSLMLGCAGRDGAPEAQDPVDRESSHVQAVVAYFPPTDFLNWGEDAKRMLGAHPLVPLEGAFAFHRLDAETNAFQPITHPAEREELGRQVSPITHVRKGNAPTLIVHGDSDTFIPLQQSERMAAKLKEAGVVSELVVMKGGGHDGILIQQHLPRAMAWFDEHLSKKQASPADR